VFRPELYSRITGVPSNSPITEQSIATIVLDNEGLMKGCPSTARRCVFLNRAEEDHTIAVGKRIAGVLREKGKGSLDRILIGAAGKEPSVLDIFDADK
jgi:probable selenium-dependent hydroxylase accessory protein YqeC